MNQLAKTKPTDLAVIEEKVGALDTIVQQCNLALSKSEATFGRALAMTNGIKQLREMITIELVNEQIMPLQNTALGFRTDKDNGYPPNVVKECAIDAVLKGASLIFNEFNIISGRTYFTKEFFTRKVKEFPGLTDLNENLGVPKVNGKAAIVDGRATWNLNGETMSIDMPIVIRVNQGMGDDAILGKAKRKLRAAIYERLTGSDLFVDGDVGDVIDVEATPAKPKDTTSRTDQIKEKLGKKQETAPGAEPAPTFAGLIKLQSEKHGIDADAAEIRILEFTQQVWNKDASQLTEGDLSHLQQLIGDGKLAVRKGKS